MRRAARFSFSRLAAVKNPQDDESVRHHAIVHHVRRIKNVENKLPKVGAPRQGAPQFRMLNQQIRFLSDFAADYLRQLREPVLQKIGKTVEVSKGRR